MVHHGGRTSTLRQAEITTLADLANPHYLLYRKNGTTPLPSDATPTVLSVHRLLEELDLPVDADTTVSIPHDGRTSLLYADELREPGSAGYPFGDQPEPGIDVATDGVDYIRSRLGSTEDNNSEHSLPAPRVELFVDSPGVAFPLTLTASRTQLPAGGGSVRFTVAKPDRPGGPLSYTWSVEGAGPQPTQGPDSAPTHTLTHAFTAGGTYTVTVTARGSGATGTASTTVRVGSAAPPEPTPSPEPGSGTSHNKHALAHGPNSSAGNRGGAPASSRPGTGTTSGTVGSATTTSGRPGQNPTRAAPGTTGTDARRVRRAPRTADRTSTLPQVQGRLIGGTRTLALAAAPASRASATAPPNRRPTVPRRSVPWVLLGVLLLLAGGALRESTVRDRLRRPLRSRT